MKAINIEPSLELKHLPSKFTPFLRLSFFKLPSIGNQNNASRWHRNVDDTIVIHLTKFSDFAIMKKLKEGDQAVIKQVVSSASLLLYKGHQHSSPVMVCPCSLTGRVVTIKKMLPNGVCLCSFKDAAITIVYPEDLDPFQLTTTV